MADARGAALGGTAAASGKGLNALHWNPAGLVSVSGHEIAVSHIRGFEDTNTEFIGLLWKRRPGHAVALSLMSNNINGIEFRTHPSQHPEGIISAHDFYTGLSYAAAINEEVQIGITVKYLYQKIYFSRSSGFSGDLGIMYSPKDRDYKFGAVLRNAGTMSALENEKPQMPALISAGGSYRLSPFSDNKNQIELSGEYEIIFEGDNYIHFGLDYSYNSRYNVRMGFISGFEDTRLSAGGGVLLNRYCFDYAFQPDVTAFGNQHIMTFRLLF